MPNQLKILDANQVIRSVYDIDRNCLRMCLVDGGAGEGPALEVIIDHTTDSIRLGDGVNLVTTTVSVGKVSLDVNVTNEIDIRDLDSSRDNISINDGTDTLDINPDGSINTKILAPSTNEANPVNVYGEVTSVNASTETTIVSFTTTTGRTSFIQRVFLSGTNIAEYRVKVNGVVVEKTRTSHRNGINSEINFEGFFNNGLRVNEATDITVTVLHVRPMVGDFNARLQVIEI